MSYLEELRSGKENPSVAYTDFILHTRESKNGLFCFFEGKDNAYYVPRIMQFTKYYHPIGCGGRSKVLEVYRLIKFHPEYNKYKKAFFIDTDFNPPLPPLSPPVFETQCYSIENFYVSVDVLKEILKNLFHLSEVNKAHQEILQLYSERQKEFHEATVLFNAWYICLMDIKNENKKPTGVNLDESLPKDFVKITLSKVSINYDLNKLKKTFPQALTVEDEKLAEKIKLFSTCNQIKVFRGKYELQFLLTFLKLIQDKKTASYLFKEKIKSDLGEISSKGILHTCSAFAETPKSLNDYLKFVTQS